MQSIDTKFHVISVIWCLCGDYQSQSSQVIIIIGIKMVTILTVIVMSALKLAASRKCKYNQLLSK